MSWKIRKGTARIKQLIVEHWYLEYNGKVYGSAASVEAAQWELRKLLVDSDAI